MSQQTDQEERRRGMTVLRDVAPYLWPAGETGTKVRVVAALSVLVLAKLIAVTTPMLYKEQGQLPTHTLSKQQCMAKIRIGVGLPALWDMQALNSFRKLFN